jgi:ubiquinone/menaquinone biosynthesis C-methylase UbiE
MNKQTQKELLEIVKNNYEEIAEKYNETRKKHLMPLWGVLVDYCQKIKKGSVVLDVGCGNGRLLEAFGDKQINYLGVDSSDELLEKAKENHPDKKFVYGDVLELGHIPQMNFDYVFSIAVFHHLPGRDLQVAALKQMKNKISQDGEIFITAWNMWSQKRFRKILLKYFLLKLLGKNKMDAGDILFDWKNNQGEAVSKRYYHAFTKRELRKVVKKAGLKIEKLDKDKYNYYLILKK